jgi:hypothetical protein
VHPRRKIPIAPPLPIPRFPRLGSRRFVPKNNRFLEVSDWLSMTPALGLAWRPFALRARISKS